MPSDRPNIRLVYTLEASPRVLKRSVTWKAPENNAVVGTTDNAMVNSFHH